MDDGKLTCQLLFAARNGHVETVRELLEQHKADVHACGSDKWEDEKPDHALRWAAHNGHTDTVRVLLAHKADVHVCGSWDGTPDAPLRWAAQNGHTDTVRVLLAHKADVHGCGYDGKPDGALRRAARNGRTVCVLLAHKADVHACGSDEWDGGKTDYALRWAAENNHTDTVRVLLEHKANMDYLPEKVLQDCLSMRRPSRIRRWVSNSLGFSAHEDEIKHVGRVAFGMRLGRPVLSRLPARVLSLSTFDSCRRDVMTKLIEATGVSCRDLTEMVLLYV